MTVTKNIAHVRYRGGKTITIPPAGNSGSFTLKECQELLGINSAMTLYVYRKTLGFLGQRRISWEQIKEMLALQEFLRVRHGYNSKQMYLNLRNQNLLQTIFEEFGIDIQAKFERIQNDYNNKRQAQTQQSIRTYQDCTTSC